MKSVSTLFALLLAAPALAADPVTPVPHAGMTMNKQQMLTHSGKVLSTIRVPGYIYLEVSQGKKTLWLAAATAPVKKGDMVRFDDGMEMTDFYSNSIKRTFPSIIFVNSLVVDNVKK